MAVATKYTLAPAGSTGNNTHTAVTPVGRWNDQVGFQFVVEVAGATPTVTWKVQGSFDGTNWYDLFYITDSTDTGAAAARTATAVGAQAQWVSNALTGRAYPQYRLVTSANTNITYRGEMWLFEDMGG